MLTIASVRLVGSQYGFLRSLLKNKAISRSSQNALCQSVRALIFRMFRQFMTAPGVSEARAVLLLKCLQLGGFCKGGVVADFGNQNGFAK